MLKKSGTNILKYYQKKKHIRIKTEKYTYIIYEIIFLLNILIKKKSILNNIKKIK